MDAERQTLRLSRRSALAGLAVPFVALALPALGGSSALAAGAVGRNVGAVGYLYVNDNTAGVNTVAGFARLLDGTLAPLAGSPFAVGGRGTGSTVASQGSLQLALGGRYLLVANAGSNSISVLRIVPDGSLDPVPGSPFPSGGSEPVSIAVCRDLVYVANTGDGGANYTGFRLGADGRLWPLAGSTVAVPDGSVLGDVVLSGNGRNLVGVRVASSLIDSFAVGIDGSLTAAAGSPFAAQAPGPFGSAFRPTNPGQLFVSNAHGGANKGSVSAYDVARDGALQSIGASPYADWQTAPCWVTVSRDGQYLFAANAGSDSLTGYAIGWDGTLRLVGSTTLRGGPGLGTFDLGIDPSGQHLYVVDATKRLVSLLAVDGGLLTELPSSPISLPAGASPYGLAVTTAV